MHTHLVHNIHQQYKLTNTYIHTHADVDAYSPTAHHAHICSKSIPDSQHAQGKGFMGGNCIDCPRQ